MQCFLLHDTGPIITSATTTALTETVLLTATSTVNVTPPGVSTTEGMQNNYYETIM